MKLLLRLTACLLLAGAAQAQLMKPAQVLKPVEVVIYPAGFNFPLWVASERGYFTANGIAPHFTTTPNSVFQLTNLIDGRFDIAMTAMDNIVAYDEGEGEGPTRNTPDAFAFMGGSSGFLSLVTASAIARYEDLRGKTLSVDALTTGYAFVLQKMLENAGLREGDYSLAMVGGMVERYRALIAGQQVSTLLVPPYVEQARAQGFRVLDTPTEALGAYQASSGAARRSWAREHRAEVVGFIRAYVAAVDWLQDPANKAAAIAIFQRNMAGTSLEAASQSYDTLLDPVHGFTKKAKLDRDGVKTVMALRSQYAKPPKALTEPEKYYDLSYYDEAMAVAK